VKLVKMWALPLCVAVLIANPVRAHAETATKPAGTALRDPGPSPAAARANATPVWPQPLKPRPGAPNIVLILLDDVGFGAASVMGGPVKTPELETLADKGLRYNNFHVNAMCSPTRAALLSGRNDHQVGFGSLADLAAGFPGYNTIWPKSAASVAEVLRLNGYSTAAFGKWHNTPTWEVDPAGPFDRWPTSMGFEYFYGFQAAEDSQWEPRLFRNTLPVEPPATKAAGYHLTTDLVDDAMHWLRQHDASVPGKPFFLYFATGATHAPHQVPEEWIDRYKGQFDEGWDRLREETFARQKAAGLIPANAKLTPRPAELPAWDSLSPEQRKLLAREAEVYAGFLAQTDYEVGRLLRSIREDGHGDNTLVFYIVGDNGASSEAGLYGQDLTQVDGSPASISERLQRADELGSEAFYNHYSAAWAWGLTTPFKGAKIEANYLGGTTDPMIVSWPARIQAHGEVRSQFQHITDIVPTIYEVAGITAPAVVNGVKQLALEGKSLAGSFADATAPSTHHVQFFETLGYRGIYKDGWWAGTPNIIPSWEIYARYDSSPVGAHPWELYKLDSDYSQADDLASQYPQKLQEMVALFDREARRNNVYPLVPSFTGHPGVDPHRTSFVYRSGVERIPVRVGPQMAGRSHTITARVTIPESGAEGVIIAEGGRLGGFTLYVKNGHVVYEANAWGNSTGRIVSSTVLPQGPVAISVDFEVSAAAKDSDLGVLNSIFQPSKRASVRLSIDGKAAGETVVANMLPFYLETLDVGSDLGSPVSPDYASPFRFTGTIETVSIDLR
jgi:arylsulfatase A-like enzyme